MNWSKSEIKFMREALRLAKRGRGKTSPNPLVGAVVVRNNRIIGRGYHRGPGKPHAEVIAIDSSAKPKGSILYVNLEPCVHYGRTPPCVDKIIEAGLKKVILSVIDPNPYVSGKGIEKLRGAGISVEYGLLEKEAKRLNEFYFKYITTKLPFVILKIALTLDGKIADADRESKWISCEASRKFVHRLRSEVDGVVVGIETVLKDDPNLTSRSKRNPLRIVLDSNLRIPSNAKILNDEARTVIVTTVKKKTDHQTWVVEKNRQGRVNLLKFLKVAGKSSLTSILVEGGAEVFTSFLKERLVDKVLIFVSPKILANGLPFVKSLGIEHLKDALNLAKVSYKRIGEDLLIEGYL